MGVHVAGDVRIFAERRHDGVAVRATARDHAHEIEAEIPGGHEFQFEFLTDRPVTPATSGKSSGGLALEFAFTDITDVGAEHEAKQMLGIEEMPDPRYRRGRTRFECCTTMEHTCRTLIERVWLSGRNRRRSKRKGQALLSWNRARTSATAGSQRCLSAGQIASMQSICELRRRTC